MYRGFAGTEHVQVSGRYYRTTGTKRSGQVRSEQSHPRPRLVRVPPTTGLQAGMGRRASHRRAAAEHVADVPGLRPCVGGQPPDAGPVSVRRMRFRGKRRSGRRDQHSQGGTRPLRL